MAAVTTHSNLSGLRPQELTLNRSRCRNQKPGLEGPWGGASCPFQLLGLQASWLVAAPLRPLPRGCVAASLLHMATALRATGRLLARPSPRWHLSPHRSQSLLCPTRLIVTAQGVGRGCIFGGPHSACHTYSVGPPERCNELASAECRWHGGAHGAECHCERSRRFMAIALSPPLLGGAIK